MVLHQHAGETLERAGIATARRAVDLARHFSEAAPLGLEDKAAECAERAGDDAAARFAFAEAARWYEQAVLLREGRREPYHGTGRMLLAPGRAHADDGPPERPPHAPPAPPHHAPHV